MGLLAGILERMGWRKPVTPARHRVVASLPRPKHELGKPVEPMETGRPLPTAAATPAAAAPAESAAPPKAVKSEAELAREAELKELRRSFQVGILDVRFKDLDIDHRFLEDFRKLLEAGHEAFSVPPAAAFDVMRIVDDPGYPVKKVAAAISCDPSLAGSVLSLANSPLHRGANAVESLPDAIVRLGQRSLRLLLLEIALHSTRVKAKPYETFSTLAWKHSLLCAQLAHVVAKMAGVDPDHAYMAGLFHDIGTFAVLSAARKLANRQSRKITAQTLLKLIDAHAHALDERVVAAWRLPDPVAQAVIHRREPHHARDHAGVAAVTAIANDLGRPFGAWIPKQSVDFAKHEAVELLKIAPAQLPDEAAILEIAQKIEKVAGLQ